MPIVTDMTFPLLRIDEQEFADDPTPFVDAAREQHPWLALSPVGAYVVHGYKAARELLLLDKKLKPYFGGMAKYYDAENTPWGHFMAEMMNASHGPGHIRLRKSAAPAFTPQNIELYRDLIRSVITDMVDEWGPNGSFDFVEFASFYPITVFCGLLGVSPKVVPQIRSALETQVDCITLNPDLRPDLLAAFDLLWDFADSAVKEQERIGTTGNSLLELMIRARDEGKVNDTEVRQNVIMFATGGYDSTKNMLGRIVHLLLQNPGHWERCAQDLTYCVKVVDEGFRHSGVGIAFRSVLEEFEYDGIVFPKDTVLIFPLALTGRDPSVFPDPLNFQPERPNSDKHVGMGRGMHVCIGQHLARAVLIEGLHIITKRLTNPRLSGEVTWRPFLGVWGARTMPIIFDGFECPSELS